MPARRYLYTWDQINSLNADYMARRGAFQPGCEAWVGFGGSAEDLRIQYRMDLERQVFSVRYSACRIRHEMREASVEQWVSVERRPCRLGGHRVYFRCPQCSCSTLNLAVLPEGLRCASCGSITWASRRERAPQRLIRRANKVARVLRSGNWDDEPEVRPPYMRIAVFHALKTERAKLAEQIYEHMDRQFMQSARVRRLLARRNR